MFRLTPERIIKQYTRKRIDRQACKELLISYLERSDREAERIQSIDYMSNFEFTDLQDYEYFEQLFLSDDMLEIRLAAFTILIKNFFHKVMELIKWVLDNDESPDIVAGVLNISLNFDSERIRNLIIEELKTIMNLKIHDYDTHFRAILEHFQKDFTELFVTNQIERLSTEELCQIYLNYKIVIYIKKKFDPWHQLLIEVKEGYVTEFDFEGNSELNWEKLSDITGILHLDHLEILDLKYCYLRDVSEIEKLPLLKILIIMDSLLTEIKGLVKLKNLENLQLVGNQITEISGLDTNHSLEVLNLGNNKISKIKGLENLQNLKYLYLDCNKILEIDGLEHLINLEELNLVSNKIKEVKNLDGLKSLRKISFYENQIQEFPEFSSLENLEEINLGYNQITEIKGVEKIKALTHLSLSDNPIKEMSDLEKVNNILYLSLDGIKLDSATDAYIKELNSKKPNLIIFGT